MKVLVTGSNGFIGKHVCLNLTRQGFDVLPFDVENTDEELKNFISEVDFIIHLAGINRPLAKEEFYSGNTNLTKKIVDYVTSSRRRIPIIMSSSIQAELNNDYGKSKKMAEDYLFNSGLPVYVYRLNNVFGKWCKPNYNSVIATFCYNIAHDLDITISSRDNIVTFNYIDDVCDEFIKCLNSGGEGSREILSLDKQYSCNLGTIADLLYYFKREVESERHLPLLNNEFEFLLFKTFLDYLSDSNHKLNYAKDERGSFEELYKNEKWGQISDNVSYPGITKGGHYHSYKKEIFYTVIGNCEIKQRNIKTNEMVVNVVDGKKPQLVDIKTGYTHQITNIGKINSHTLMWISEIYSPDTPDTYKEEVEK